VRWWHVIRTVSLAALACAPLAKPSCVSRAGSRCLPPRRRLWRRMWTGATAALRSPQAPAVWSLHRGRVCPPVPSEPRLASSHARLPCGGHTTVMGHACLIVAPVAPSRRACVGIETAAMSNAACLSSPPIAVMARGTTPLGTSGRPRSCSAWLAHVWSTLTGGAHDDSTPSLAHLVGNLLHRAAPASKAGQSPPGRQLPCHLRPVVTLGAATAP
jgi:hypothetical protein